MSPRSTPLILLILIALLAALSFGCQSEAEGASQANDLAVSAETGGPARVRVRTLEIAESLFEEKLELTGRLLPWEDVTVSSELGGLVREINFDKGDWIKKGQVLARVGDDIAEIQLEQARAELAGAVAVFDRQTQLFARQAVPQQDLIDATSQKDRLKARVAEMELRVERSILTAPISGQAVDRQIEAGEVIGPGTEVTTIQLSSNLKVEAFVPDTEVSWLREGRTAQVRVDAYPERAFEARLHFISPAANASTRSFPIELTLPNREKLLRPGMVSRIALLRRRVDNGIVIPIDAMVTREGGKFVFLIDECIAQEIPVEPTAYEGDQALIEGPLAAGQHLVVDGQRDLIDGHEVHSEECR